MTFDSTFEPDEILKCRIKDEKKQYLVRWKHYSNSNATWEFCSSKIKDLVQKYEETIQNKGTWKPKEPLMDENVYSIIEIRIKRPKLVIASTVKEKKLYYRVQFADDTFQFVSASMLRQVCPSLICQFLENKIEFSSEENPSIAPCSNINNTSMKIDSQ